MVLSLSIFVSAETTIDVSASGDNAEVTAQVKDGEVSFDILYGDGSQFTHFGKDDYRQLKASSTNTITIDDDTDKYFVATYVGTNPESYLLEIGNIDDEFGEGVVELRNSATGQTICQDKKAGDKCYIGNVELRIDEINVADESVQIKILHNGILQKAYEKLTLNENVDEYLVATASGESYLLEIGNIDDEFGEGVVELRNSATGQTICQDKKAGDKCYIGNVELRIDEINVADESVQIKILHNGILQKAYEKLTLNENVDEYLVATIFNLLVPTKLKEEIVVASDDICENVGIRKEGKYCSDTEVWTTQKETSASCENNFECDSNLCLENECVSGNLISRFLRWLKNLFS